MTKPDTSPEAIAALMDGVTEGPWDLRTLENFGWNVVSYKGGNKFDIVRVAKSSDEANARFIAAARDLVPALAAENEKLRAVIKFLQDLDAISVAAVLELTDERDALTAEVARLKEALTPSGDTKAAYMGEVRDDVWGGRIVSWTAIKAVMAMISAHADLKGGDA